MRLHMSNEIDSLALVVLARHLRSESLPLARWHAKHVKGVMTSSAWLSDFRN